jgi:hypothetical protein
MDKHALAVLAAAESWGWPFKQRIERSGEQGDRYTTVTVKLFSCCITESTAYSSSTFVDQFWREFEKCHPKFLTNGELHLSNAYIVVNIKLYYSSTPRIPFGTCSARNITERAV